jgi:hypothetical protein
MVVAPFILACQSWPDWRRGWLCRPRTGFWSRGRGSAGAGSVLAVLEMAPLTSGMRNEETAVGIYSFSRERTMSPLVLILVVILILVVLGGGYGYRSGNNLLAGGGGLVGLILIILIILFLLGRL